MRDDFRDRLLVWIQEDRAANDTLLETSKDDDDDLDKEK